MILLIAIKYGMFSFIYPLFFIIGIIRPAKNWRYSFKFVIKCICILPLRFSFYWRYYS